MRLATAIILAASAAATPAWSQPATGQPPAPREATGPEFEACDRAAAAPTDADKPANIPGIDFKSMSGSPAVVACAKAAALPGAPRRMFFQLARAYDKLKVPRDALAAYQVAAEMKHPGAMHNMAILYSKGAGVPRDYGRARALFEAAAAAGVSASYHEIGVMYGSGQGGPRDWAQARFYYEKAIALGEALSYANLGNLYFYGQGVGQDRNAACNLYGQGATAGDPVASGNLNRHCRQRG